MGSKYFPGARSSFDYSQAFINMDTMCQVYSTTQETLGKKPTFIEKNKPEVVESKPEETHKCGAECKKPCQNKSDKTFDLTFTGVFSENYSDSEEDEDYICDFCNALGYGRKYRPEICDNCTQCQSCAEYEEEECSGCSYSVFRDGSYYRDKLTDEQLFSGNDLDILKTVKLDTTGGDRIGTDKSFTVTSLNN